MGGFCLSGPLVSESLLMMMTMMMKHDAYRFRRMVQIQRERERQKRKRKRCIFTIEGNGNQIGQSVALYGDVLAFFRTILPIPAGSIERLGNLPVFSQVLLDRLDQT